MTAAASPTHTPPRFARFVQQMAAVVEAHDNNEPALLDAAQPLLQDLVRHDDWLPDAYAVPSNETYRQYLLYRDPRARFSVVSFVWQPGQKTPVHDHTVWGLVGVMRGEERCEEFAPPADGRPARACGDHALRVGEVDRVSPTLGDVHRVSNAGAVTAVSIHVYGADIGATRRHVFDPATGAVKDFVSGYSNGALAPLLGS